MAVTTLSSREFNQDTGAAKKAAQNGPVIITDRGKPAHVLLNIEEYEKLTSRRRPNIIDAIGMTDAADLDFDPPLLKGPLSRPADFS